MMTTTLTQTTKVTVIMIMTSTNIMLIAMMLMTIVKQNSSISAHVKVLFLSLRLDPLGMPHALRAVAVLAAAALQVNSAAILGLDAY